MGAKCSDGIATSTAGGKRVGKYNWVASSKLLGMPPAQCTAQAASHRAELVECSSELEAEMLSVQCILCVSCAEGDRRFVCTGEG